MKILILTSGGDAPGMNKFIWEIYKKFKKETYYAQAGFAGLISGQIYPLADVIDKKQKNCAGVVTKSSRCPEFKLARFFNKGLANARYFDVVIILGGNGSEKGAKRLYEHGTNTIFVPATIDNDVLDCAQSIGFSTAVKEGVYAVENSMPSIRAFTNSCIFEVMGRDCDAICKAVAKQTNADYAVCTKKDLDMQKMKDIILRNYVQGGSSCIVVKENLMEAKRLADELNQELGINMVKYQIVGRTQRGGHPTKDELRLAKRYAKETKKCIKTKVFGVRILIDENGEIVVKEFD